MHQTCCYPLDIAAAWVSVETKNTGPFGCLNALVHTEASCKPEFVTRPGLEDLRPGCYDGSADVWNFNIHVLFFPGLRCAEEAWRAQLKKM